jgi:hypothetical protein
MRPFPFLKMPRKTEGRPAPVSVDRRAVSIPGQSRFEVPAEPLASQQVFLTVIIYKPCHTFSAEMVISHNIGAGFTPRPAAHHALYSSRTHIDRLQHRHGQQ